MPERRTKRFPPRFRPVGRFCELSFRYQSSPTGSEGEISRPLDHLWQIPFIHSAQFMTCGNFDIYNTAFWLFHTCGTINCILVRCQFDNYACAFAETLFSRIRAIIQVMFCSIRGVVACAYTGTKYMKFTQAHLLSKRNDSLSHVVPLNLIYLFTFLYSGYSNAKWSKIKFRFAPCKVIWNPESR